MAIKPISFQEACKADNKWPKIILNFPSAWLHTRKNSYDWDQPFEEDWDPTAKYLDSIFVPLKLWWDWL